MYRLVGRARVVSVVFAAILAASAYPAFATSIPGARGLTVSVDPSGTFDIQVADPAWDFGGNIGAALLNVGVVAGSDAVGTYLEIGFDFQTDAARHGAIRAYQNHQSVLFTLSCPYGAPNSLAFPNLSRYPAGLNHIGFAGLFANYTFTSLPPESPWIYFDSVGHTFVVSAASNFMVSQNSSGPNGEILAGIAPSISSLPAGFTNQVLLVVDSGINRTFDSWGNVLTTLQGKTRPGNDADVSLSRLNYWTDNGATYYYHPETTAQAYATAAAANPSATPYEQTLWAVKGNLQAMGVGLGAMQLDSWFYPKGPALDWSDSADGIYEYMASPTLFTAGLQSFQQTLKVPLITHARWIDPSSPYRKTYQISGNVAIDPAYWNNIAQYLKLSGVSIYEQDWLGAQAQTNFNLNDPAAFLDNMAGAMAQQGIDMQYCMATPRHFLQGSKYSNLTTIRASGDRFESSKWSAFLYSSRLAGSMGVWPFTDVFMSSETANLILATLSAGPVGIGDPLGSISQANLMQSVRKDGVIVKPDAPLMPVDASFQNDSQATQTPMVASTYSDIGGIRTWYVAAYPQGSNTTAQFSPAELGASHRLYLYDYLAASGHLINAADKISAPISNGFLFLIAAPVGPSGMAILGDAGNFVGMGRKRISSFSDDGTVQLTVAFADGETSRTIQGYSPDQPRVRALDGTVSPLLWNPATRRFRVTVAPGADGSATIALHRQPSAAPRHQ